MSRSKAIVGEIWSRIFVLGIPAIALVLLAAALGFNNASRDDPLPTMLNNCTTFTFDVDGLVNSVNIFAGIFLALTAIAVIYEGVVLFLRIINLEMLNNNKWFLFIDIALSFIFMSVFIGAMTGSYHLGSSRNYYQTTFSLDDKPFRTTTGLIWGCFGVYISAIYQMLGIGIRMICCCNSNKRCNSAGCEPGKDKEKVLGSPVSSDY